MKLSRRHFARELVGGIMKCRLFRRLITSDTLLSFASFTDKYDNGKIYDAWNDHYYMFVWQKIALDKLLVRLHKMYDAIGQATQTTIDPATKVEKIETVMGKLECKSCCTLNKPVAFSLPVIFLRFSFIEEVRSLLFKQNCDLLSFLTNATTQNYVIMKGDLLVKRAMLHCSHFQDSKWFSVIKLCFILCF